LISTSGETGASNETQKFPLSQYNRKQVASGPADQRTSGQAEKKEKIKGKKKSGATIIVSEQVNQRIRKTKERKKWQSLKQ